VEVTYSPKGTGKRIIFQGGGKCLYQSIFPEQCDIGGNPHGKWTGVGAKLFHQGLAGSSLTSLSQNMVFILLRKIS
jgi:hypothetical protein